MNRVSGDQGLRRGFGALEMLYWCTYGSFTTYIVSYVTAVRGVSASAAGGLLALFMLCACAGQFAVNAVCDRFRNNRTVFMVGMAVTVLLYGAVYFSPSLPVLFALYGLLGFVQPALGSALDTWLIRSFPQDPDAYSPIRAMGSISYSVVMIVMGYAIEGIGHCTMLILGAVFGSAAVMMAAWMPEIPAALPEQGVKTGGSLRSLKPMVWMFIAALAVLGTGNLPLLNMNLMVLENVGGTVAHTGIATCFNTVAEFFMMRFGARALTRLSARRKLLLSSFLYLGSTVVMLLARSVPVLYLVFFVNGLAYGILLPARRQMIGETVPYGLLNRMHGVADLAYMNLGGLIGNQLGGFLIDSRGTSMMVTVSLVMQVLAIGMLLMLKQSVRAGTGQKGIDRDV